MNKYWFILVVSSLLSFSHLVEAREEKNNSKILVIKNSQNATKKITKSQLRNIFLGRNTLMFEPVIPPQETLSRIIFNMKIIGLNESRIQSFYAQMRFSGRARPPKEIATTKKLLEYVANTTNAISYVPSNSELPHNVEIIYIITN